MTNGIYLYYDTEKNSVVYVGRDSYIDKNKRHKAHMSGKSQQFDKILQNNPDRYKYVVFCEGNFSNEELNDLEIQAIKLFNTHQREDAFNYTEGGDGVVGFEHSEESKKKMSEAKKGKYCGENNPMYGRKQSEESRKKISEAHKKNYATVIKYGFHNGKQRYALRHNGKTIKRSIYKEKLEKETEERNKKHDDIQ